MPTDTDTNLDMLISRVEKLWRKAGDPAATEAERAAFETKALQLMEQHRITEQMLDLGFEDVLGDHEYGKFSGRNARLAIDILNAVANAFDGRVWWRNYGLNYTVYIFGFKSDFERIKALAAMLIVDAQSGAAKLSGYNASNTIALRRGFMQGYRWTIARRLQEAKAAAYEAERQSAALRTLFGDDVDLDDDIDWSDYEDEIAAAAAADTTVSSAALVLVEKGKQVAAEFSKKKLRSAASTSSGSYVGRQAGSAAAERASLSSNRGVASARKALS